jgi:hypothetical protein
MEWLRKPENRSYVDIFIGKQRENSIDYQKIFNKVDKIWLSGCYIIAQKNNGYDNIITNPDLERFLIEESTDVTMTIEPKKENEFIDSDLEMSIDSILDKISKVGIEGITESEKNYLDKNS